MHVNFSLSLYFAYFFANIYSIECGRGVGTCICVRRGGGEVRDIYIFTANFTVGNVSEVLRFTRATTDSLVGRVFYSILRANKAI